MGNKFEMSQAAMDETAAALAAMGGDGTLIHAVNRCARALERIAAEMEREPEPAPPLNFIPRSSAL